MKLCYFKVLHFLVDEQMLIHCNLSFSPLKQDHWKAGRIVGSTMTIFSVYLTSTQDFLLLEASMGSYVCGTLKTHNLCASSTLSQSVLQHLTHRECVRYTHICRCTSGVCYYVGVYQVYCILLYCVYVGLFCVYIRTYVCVCM